MRPVLRIAAALLTASLLGGCGQRGDLYLPDEPSETVLVPATSSPQPQASPEDAETEARRQRATQDTAGN